MTHLRKPSPIDRIHSTRTPTKSGGIELARADYDLLYAHALRGAGMTPRHAAAGDLPQVDGLDITDLGIFDLPEDSGAHSEFRVWLNNGQRLAYAIPACQRLRWFEILVRSFFRRDLERAI